MILDNVDFTKRGVFEVLVSAAIAAVILKDRNTNNRSISATTVGRYAADMENGQWFENEQNKYLGFYSDGILADGQHRLSAIVKSGIGRNMRIEVGLPREHSYGIDAHRMRATNDQIKIAGGNAWIDNRHIAIMKLLYRFDGSKNMSPQDVVAACNMYKDELVSVSKIFTRRLRNLTTTPILAATMMASRHEDPVRMSEFAQVLTTGMANGHEDFAAIRLREKLLAGQSTSGDGARKEVMKLTMRAIKAFCDRQNIKKLMMPDDFIYEVSL